MKEETPEEAYDRIFDGKLDRVLKAGFIAGAQWNQERSYSEEDMEKAIKFGAFGMYGYKMGEEGKEVNQVKTFLETFKNK